MYLGRVENPSHDLTSTPVQRIDATFSGFAGEAHSGLTRWSDSRVQALYPIDTEIRNTRQFSILSAEDMSLIATEMGLEDLDPSWVGASMVIKGIPDFTLVPPSSRLRFESGATLTVDVENRPCIYPSKIIEKMAPGKGKSFKPAARHRRGVTAWVEREGKIKLGDTLRLFIPDQPVWPHLKD